MSTRHLLRGLGFQPVQAQWTEQQPGYQYDFGNLVLEVAELNSFSLTRVMHFSGVQSGTHSVPMAELELPLNVECYEQGLALLSHALGRDFRPLIPTDWLDQGRRLEAYLPGKRRGRAYEKRPQCYVDADWFRVAAKKLIALGAASNADDSFTVSFQDSILRFDTEQDVVVVPAQGLSWNCQYRCRTTCLTQISKRTLKTGVWLSVWEAKLSIGRAVLNVDTPPDKH